MVILDGMLLGGWKQLLKDLLGTEQSLFSSRDTDSMKLQRYYLVTHFHMPLDHTSASNSSIRGMHSPRVLLVVNKVGFV